MTVLAFWFVVVGFGAAFVSMVSYYRVASQGKSTLRLARSSLLASTSFVVLASLSLLALLLQHDFSNGYVFSYSSHSLPLEFLISSFYAGQEGSFLFWALCSSIIAVMLVRSTQRWKTESHVMTVFMGVQTFLLLLLIIKSPFRSVWEMFPQAIAGQIPADGRGLNPLLQNFWMVIHPPVLFVGFAAMAVPFSFAIAGLWKKQYSVVCSQAFAWVLFAALILGAGIMLGAYWAYGVLGWGGYWGWDPVENSSLIPWITSVALIHTILAQRKSMKYVRTNHILAILSFFLVIYSTFLTRSGILGESSVHSFVDPGAAVYWILIGFLVVIAGLSLSMMLLRWRDMKVDVQESPVFTKENLLGMGAVAILLSALVVAVGTSLPIFSSSSVDPSFYDTTNIPIVILIGMLIGFSLFARWGAEEERGSIARSVKALLVSATIVAVLYFFGLQDWTMIAIAYSAVFAFVVNVQVGVRARSMGIRHLGGKIAHAGLALFFLGVISTGRYSETKHLSLELRVPQQAFGYALTYVGYQPTGDGKFAFLVDAEKDGKKFQLAPVMFEAGEQGIMRNPDIASFLTKDLYISPVSLDQPTAHAGSHETYTLAKGEAVSIGGVQARFVRFDMDQHGSNSMSGEGAVAVGSVLELSRGTSTETVVPLAIYSGNGSPEFKSSTSKLMNANVQLVSMDVGMGTGKSTITLMVDQSGTSDHHTEALVVEASVKPYISVLWGGTLLLMAGFTLSAFKRSKEK